MKDSSTLQDAINTFASRLNDIEETIDTVDQRGYALHRKNYRPIWKTRTRKLLASFFAIRRIETPTTHGTVQELELHTKEILNEESDLATKKENVRYCRMCIEDLQKIADQESEILLDTNPYLAYTKLKAIILHSKKQVSIIDPYVNAQTIERYIEPLPKNIHVRLLTRVMDPDFKAVASICKKTHPSFDVRISNGVHDRHLIIDRRAWIIGQSLKDAGSNAPLSIVELRDATSIRHIFEGLWSSANPIF
jgi:hypothetical protein